MTCKKAMDYLDPDVGMELNERTDNEVWGHIENCKDCTGKMDNFEKDFKQLFRTCFAEALYPYATAKANKTTH